MRTDRELSQSARKPIHLADHWSQMATRAEGSSLFHSPKVGSVQMVLWSDSPTWETAVAPA
jgi:hypothetical protein